MAPIKTVGDALSGGIVVVHFDDVHGAKSNAYSRFGKPKHPPLKVFDAAVDVPVKRNTSVIGFFLILVLVSATLGQANVEENIDLLEWRPKVNNRSLK